MTRLALLAAFTLPIVGLATAAAFASLPDRTSSPRRNAVRTEAPVDTLVAQLQRRFSDTRDADFGYGRVSRPLARLHSGATMDRNDLLYSKTESEDENAPIGMNRNLVRRTKSGDYELKTERGTWIPFEKARDQMRPENATERRAIHNLLLAKREIAIYTFGAFHEGRTGRWHGPAYLDQLGPKAPEAEGLKGVANAAWTGGKPSLLGYRLRIERIFAEDSCLKCHNDLRATPTGDRPMGPKGSYRKGDPLGLVVVAERL